jgi:protein ImuB
MVSGAVQGKAFTHGRSYNLASRIGCVIVADFPVAAIVRANPALRERPFALVPTAAPSPRGTADAHRAACGAQFNPHSELSHVSPTARAAGLRPGMTVAQGRTLIADLVVLNRSPAAERAAADALIDAAESISPIVEEHASGCVWLDLAGCARQYRHTQGVRGAHDPQNALDPSDAHEADGAIEEGLAQELARRARRIGLEAAVGVAASKEIARLAAQCGGVRVIAPGREREFLDWMPLDLLELGVNEYGADLEMLLKRLGIRRLGELKRLDSRAVGSRLGARGVELMRLVRGESTARVIARPRAEVFAEAIELDYGVESLEPLSFVLRTMIERLAERLALRGFAAGDMTLELGLADRRRNDRRVAVAAPTIEARALLTLINLSLAAAPPPAAVETLRLTIEPRAPRPAQSDLFLPPTPAPDRLEAAIARIAALCGPDQVGMLTAADSYRPEAMRVGRFAPPPPTAKHRAESGPVAPPPAANAVTQIVMRTIRPAEEVEVLGTHSAPAFVRGRRICARVVSAAGPWRRQGEWWAASGDADAGGTEVPQAHAPAAYARDYYDLALADGGVYRLYCDLYSGKWYVDGLYD